MAIDPTKRIVRFTGSGPTIYKALDKVTTNIANAIVCGTFNVNQLYRILNATHKRLTEEGIDYDGNNPNTG